MPILIAMIGRYIVEICVEYVQHLTQQYYANSFITCYLFIFKWYYNIWVQRLIIYLERAMHNNELMGQFNIATLV